MHIEGGNRISRTQNILIHSKISDKNSKKGIKGAKRNFYYEKFNSCLGSSRQTYKLLNDIQGKSFSKANILFLDLWQKNYDEPSHYENVQAFNEYFSTIGANLSKDLITTNHLGFPRVE